MHKHEDLAQEIIQEQYIRKAIRSVLEQKFAKQLKQYVESKNLLLEDEVEDLPHHSTGINVLEELLKKIIPVLEADYKKLTTSGEQRQSYRAHIVNAIKNSLEPIRVTVDAGQEEQLAEISPLTPEVDASQVSQMIMEALLDELDVVVGGNNAEEDPALDDLDSDIPPPAPEVPEDNPEFIDIDKKEDHSKQPPVDNFDIPGADETGRNFAATTFQKVERQILDSFGLLANEEDRKLFYDYLITNVKLYFDRFEQELQVKVKEPPSAEYNKAKQNGM